MLANRIVNAVEQNRSRRAVEETERKLSELAGKTDDVLFMMNGDWSELLFVNSAYEDIFAGRIAALREDPESFLEYLHPDDRESVLRSLRHIASGEPDALEYRIIRPDGETRWVRAESKPILDDEGAVSRIVGSFATSPSARNGTESSDARNGATRPSSTIRTSWSV